jgi:hypothetical protein
MQTTIHEANDVDEEATQGRCCAQVLEGIVDRGCRHVYTLNRLDDTTIKLIQYCSHEISDITPVSEHVELDQCIGAVVEFWKPILVWEILVSE